jgi:hypothetical protein
MSDEKLILSDEGVGGLLDAAHPEDKERTQSMISRLWNATQDFSGRPVELVLRPVQPQALEPVGEEPCDCDPDMRIASDCDRLGCREARKSGAVQIERQPEDERESTEEGLRLALNETFNRWANQKYADSVPLHGCEKDKVRATAAAFRNAADYVLDAQPEQSHTEEGRNGR